MLFHATWFTCIKHSCIFMQQHLTFMPFHATFMHIHAGSFFLLPLPCSSYILSWYFMLFHATWIHEIYSQYTSCYFMQVYFVFMLFHAIYVHAFTCISTFHTIFMLFHAVSCYPGSCQFMHNTIHAISWRYTACSCPRKWSQPLQIAKNKCCFMPFHATVYIHAVSCHIFHAIYMHIDISCFFMLRRFMPIHAQYNTCHFMAVYCVFMPPEMVPAFTDC